MGDPVIGKSCAKCIANDFLHLSYLFIQAIYRRRWNKYESQVKSMGVVMVLAMYNDVSWSSNREGFQLHASVPNRAKKT